MTEELFMTALNNRLFRISHRDDPPFYAGSVSPLPRPQDLQSDTVALCIAL